MKMDLLIEIIGIVPEIYTFSCVIKTGKEKSTINKFNDVISISPRDFTLELWVKKEKSLIKKKIGKLLLSPLSFLTESIFRTLRS